MKIRAFWILLALLLATMVFAAGIVMADRDGRGGDDDWSEQFFRSWLKTDNRLNESQYSQLYREECGSCHFPFQPVFLPTASWQTMMHHLDDHFGENAELSDEDHANLLNYLTSNAADKVNREIPNKIMWSLRYTSSPQRITDTAFFKHEHDEIPYTVMNKKTGEQLSFSNCDTCHRRAMQGSYNEHEIDIPGIGRWED
ncbi:MAG: hypothetical protein AB2792_06705 [Candidatus Thiodiazotropha sp.]